MKRARRSTARATGLHFMMEGCAAYEKESIGPWYRCLDGAFAARADEGSKPHLRAASTWSRHDLQSFLISVRRVAWSARNGKRERCTWPFIRLGPETAMMFLDDGAADGQPDSHSILFCCIEGLKQLVAGFRR